MAEHVILVAVNVVSEESRRDAMEYLVSVLKRDLREARDPLEAGETAMDSWWLAEDDREPSDNSDNDSAVFCKPGRQIQARDLLRKNDLAW
jgi:hypothetical protein